MISAPGVSPRRFRLLLGALLTASGVLGAPPPRLPLSACKLPGLERAARCGALEVFEDRAARTGRKIPIRVVVLPATGAERAKDAVLPFAGGPGDSPIREAAAIAGELADVLRRRDVVLVDLRGTGSSNALECTALQGRAGVLGYLESFLPVPAVRACRTALEPRADLRLYTTSLAADDVDDVRAALGYDRVDLIGLSYGTRTALEYARRHGAHVRSAVLEGVVPTDARNPLSFARDAQAALDQVLAACRRDGGCRAAFPDPAGDLARVLAELEKRPAKVRVRDTESGASVDIVLSRTAAAQSLRYMLYQPATAARIPLQLHLAAAGDYGPLADTAYLFGTLLTSAADGFFLSVTCTEDVPFFDLEEATRAARGTFLGDFRARAQKAACAEWPRGTLPPGFRDPVRSDAPVLLVSGERDPVTPASAAEKAARTLPRARLVVVPGGGHGTEGLKGVDCLRALETEFLEKGDEKAVDARCIARIEAPSFVLHDERAPEVTLTPAQLDGFVGTYVVSAGGVEAVVRRQGDVLGVDVGEGKPYALVPVGAARFRVLGAPPGFFVSFERKDGAVDAMILERGSRGSETFRRKR